MFEFQFHTKLARAGLQIQQQLLAPNPAEPVPGRKLLAAPVVDCNIIPIGKMALNRLGTDRIIRGKVAQRLIRQHHAPAKGIIRFVPLEHGDIHIGLPEFY